MNVFRQTTGPDGGSLTPLRTACLTRELVAIQGSTPELGSTQLAAELLRRVTLPGGAIRATPGGVGLAGLDTHFRLEGAVQPPVDLALGGAVLHAEFTVTGYRWAFGDGKTLTTRSPGGPGRAGQIRHEYRRAGRYPVSVQTTWSARGFLDGTLIASVDGLISSSDRTYPVQEVYGVLTA